MSDLRSRLIRLAHANPSIRPDILPLITGDSRTASTVHVAAKDTTDFIMWAFLTQKPVSSEYAVNLLERNGVTQATGGGESKRGQPLKLGETVEVQANNGPGHLQDILQPYNLRRGQVIEVDGSDIVIRFVGVNDLLRVPGGVESGKASGIYRSSIMEDSTGTKHIEAVYLPMDAPFRPNTATVEVLKEYIDRGMAVGEERSEYYFSGYMSHWNLSKENNPYFRMWTQQRGGRPRTLSPAKGKLYYVGLVGRRPGAWKAELAHALNAVLVPTP